MKPPAGWRAAAPGLFVVRGGPAAAVTAGWFDPLAGHSVEGGRGTTRWIDAPVGPIFVRGYRHGGFLGRWLGGVYGPGTPRPLREIAALTRARAAGVLAPEPLAAHVVDLGLGVGRWRFYRAGLATAGIEGRRPLSLALRSASPAQRLLWLDAVGDAVAALHAAGVHHRDLNVSNLLAAAEPGERIAVLDFDRARVARGPLGGLSRWWALRRLARSIGGLGLPEFDHGIVRARLATRLRPRARGSTGEADAAELALAAAFDGALSPAVDVLKSNPRRATVRVRLGTGSVVVKAVRRPRLWLGVLARWGWTPAGRQVRAARALSGRGFRVPEPLARREITTPGLPAASCVIATDLEAGESLLVRARRADARGRRRLARDLGRYVGALHRGGVWIADLKYDNVLVENGGFVVTDLDRVRLWSRPVPLRRALRNLVQLEWRLGWEATPREQLLFLAEWRRAAGVALRPQPLLRAFRALRRRERVRIVGRREGRVLADPGDRASVTAIVICGNEAAHIRDCLESLAWCDEIVVVDSFSTDGTFDIACALATRVVRRPWSGYVAQKSHALSLATRAWVLNVDADERVSPELRRRLERLLADDGAGYDGFAIPRLVHYLGRWWTAGGWYPGRRLRFFRREVASWGGTDPHEHVNVDGAIGRVREPLWHFTYDDVSDHVRQMNRLTEWSRGGRAPTLVQLVLRPLTRVVRSFLWRGGFRFGFEGLFVAVSSGIYAHLKYAKRAEPGGEREG